MGKYEEPKEFGHTHMSHRLSRVGVSWLIIIHFGPFGGSASLFDRQTNLLAACRDVELEKLRHAVMANIRPPRTNLVELRIFSFI